MRKKTTWDRFGVPICLAIVAAICFVVYITLLKPKVGSINTPVKTEVTQDSVKNNGI